MIDLVGALTKLLIVETALLLLALLGACFMIISKAKRNLKSKGELISFIKSEISNKMSDGKNYSAIYKIIVVLYGTIRLTAMWWFTILASVLLDFNIFQIILVMLIEIIFIGVDVNNRLAINEEHTINYLWLKNKINTMLQKTNQEETVKKITETIKIKIKKFKSVIDRVSSK